MFHPIKKLGQNFLTDPGTVNKMVEALNLKPHGETIIEIGAGHGVVTRGLCNRLAGGSNVVYAVELDARFAAKLTQMFLQYPFVKVIEADILKWLPTFDSGSIKITSVAGAGIEYKIIGSLPYYITSPILHAIAKMKILPSAAVLLVQKEVADKIEESDGARSYLSVFLKTFFDVTYLGPVSRSFFNPSPKVDGGIIKLVARTQLPLGKDQTKKYEDFLHKAFSKPRKMLNKVFSREQLQKISIDGSFRPHQIPVEKWVESFRILSPD